MSRLGGCPPGLLLVHWEPDFGPHPCGSSLLAPSRRPEFPSAEDLAIAHIPLFAEEPTCIFLPLSACAYLISLGLSPALVDSLYGTIQRALVSGPILKWRGPGLGQALSGGR